MSRSVRSVALGAMVVLSGPRPAPGDPPPADAIVAVGVAGEEAYAGEFQAQASQWQDHFDSAGLRTVVVGGDDTEGDAAKQSLQAELRRAAGSGTGDVPEGATAAPLWIVLVGHGTYDGREAKFNLPGDDVSAAELATWLAGAGRPLVVLNLTAASSPFIDALSAPNRVIVTATRSPDELNFARFGKFLVRTIASPDADLDKDGAASVLEAFLAASRQVEEFYASENRIMTEHALIDDNGDRKGTPADAFEGVRPTRAETPAGVLPDGRRALQISLIPASADLALDPASRARRDELELQLFALRDRKKSMPGDEYERALEDILLQLADVYLGPDDAEDESPSQEPSTGE